MNKLIVLVGKSGSGKSTIETFLHEGGFATKVISSTTRSPRPYEVDGKDYYFISEVVFQAYLMQDQFAEHSEYPTVDGLKRYGINKNDIKLNEGNYVCVVNPHGFRQLRDNLGKGNIVSFYIHREDRDRICSTLMRDKSKDFSRVLQEAVRRYDADIIDFDGIENEVNYVIENDRPICKIALEIMNKVEEV